MRYGFAVSTHSGKQRRPHVKTLSWFVLATWSTRYVQRNVFDAAAKKLQQTVFNVYLSVFACKY